MAASLQDQQSQQAYRPPPPSSTVGVSFRKVASRLYSAYEASARIETRGWNRPQDGELHHHHPTSILQIQTKGYSTVSAEKLDHANCRKNEPKGHSYQLRDRSKLLQPVHTAEILSSNGLLSKPLRTYKDRTPRYSRRQARVGQGRRGRGDYRGGRRKRKWSTVRAYNSIDWVTVSASVSADTMWFLCCFSLSSRSFGLC